MTFLENLTQKLSRLPGIGKRASLRIIYHLLQRDPNLAKLLGESLQQLTERIQKCQTCHTYTEGTHCNVCLDSSRDSSLLCIVEYPQEMANIESTQSYHGYFFVLHGRLSPMDGVGPKSLGIEKIESLVRKRNVKEVLLATSLNPEGEATAIYIKKMLQDYPLLLTRLASGLPVGGSIDSADRLTMIQSLQGRIKFN